MTLMPAIKFPIGKISKYEYFPKLLFLALLVNCFTFKKTCCSDLVYVW